MNKTVTKLAVVAVAMFAFGFALVPLYDTICRITGINGKTQNSAVSQDKLEALRQGQEDRWITVEFIANKNDRLAWDFKALDKKVRVRPGDVGAADFLAVNTTQRDITGQATPSLAPGTAAKYFNKTECFCFTNQTLKAGEEQVMPMRFVIDPRLPKHVKTITLSYTFFEVKNVAGN